jgi:hypothetical protein
LAASLASAIASNRSAGSSIWVSSRENIPTPGCGRAGPTGRGPTPAPWPPARSPAVRRGRSGTGAAPRTPGPSPRR